MSDLAHLKSEFVWAYEDVVETPLSESPHHHPGQSALLILKGGLNVETDEGSARAGVGQWILPHQGPRVQRFEPDTRVLSVHFQLYWPGGHPLFNWPVAFVFSREEHPSLEKQTRTLIRTVNSHMPGASKHLPWLQGDVLTHFKFQRAFDAWLCVYVEVVTKAGVVPSRLAKIDPRILRVVTRLDEMPLDSALDESQLLTGTGLSASQLNRLFVRQFKLTPHQYFEDRKAARAKDLIRCSPLSIKQVAYEMGFGSLPSFSRWFRQKTDMSPRAFQKAESL